MTSKWDPIRRYSYLVPKNYILNYTYPVVFTGRHVGWQAVVRELNSGY